MKHYACKGGCGGMLDDMGICEGDSCLNRWELMEECDCTDGQHSVVPAAEAIVAKDSNGNVLQNGDNVILIKDLPLRGSSKTFKRGTKVSKIKLTDNPAEVDCKLEGMSIVLRTEFLKKIA